VSTDLSPIRFGTNSWAYKGWQGSVYQRTYPKSRFSQDTLTENAGYAVDGAPLFSTVGIDHSFYRPASAEQVPEHFRFCSKVWEEITLPAYANLPRYGPKPGNPTRDFLILARGALGPRCVLVQYGEGLRGEPAGRRPVVAAGRRLQQKRS
jgi:uncharacterized protein YecE (DUF72 family)